jgi:D-alanyl-D-alanine carboxypeptidase/D-alanyl-D-alanine-endopeptidase (penicillin-binding protein 4)
VRKGLVAALAGVVLVGGLGAAALLRPESTRLLIPTPPPSPYPARTGLLTGTADQPPPTAEGLTRALTGLLHAKGLGRRVSLSVVDATTGRQVLAVDATREVTPASTAKLATAVAALTVLDPDRRLATRVVQGRSGDVVLVGGGDASLSREGLALLAATVTRAGTPVRRVLVDDTLFVGPLLGPGWKPGYVKHGSVAPVSALAVDEGRTSDRDGSPRVSDPALTAGRRFAKLLGTREVVRGAAPAGARQLAVVRSEPVSALVEQMLTHSDNDLAEALGRQVALVAKQPASFEGESAAIAATLRGLGVEVGLRDASGLSPQDRLRPTAVTTLLAKAVRDPRYGALLSGLPVAGFDGTLQDRYRSGKTRPAAGLVRAKTGTLDGVSALAGLVRTRDGGLLAFDLTADGVKLGATGAAAKALDRIAAALAGCGCR